MPKWIRIIDLSLRIVFFMAGGRLDVWGEGRTILTEASGVVERGGEEEVSCDPLEELEMKEILLARFESLRSE